MPRDPESDPAWLIEACPSWCRRTHRDDDHPDDRVHQDVGEVLPAVVRRRATATLPVEAEALDLVLWRSRAPGQPVTWIHVVAAEQPEPAMVIAADSARLLVSALDRLT